MRFCRESLLQAPIPCHCDAQGVAPSGRSGAERCQVGGSRWTSPIAICPRDPVDAHAATVRRSPDLGGSAHPAWKVRSPITTTSSPSRKPTPQIWQVVIESPVGHSSGPRSGAFCPARLAAVLRYSSSPSSSVVATARRRAASLAGSMGRPLSARNQPKLDGADGSSGSAPSTHSIVTTPVRPCVLFDRVRFGR